MAEQKTYKRVELNISGMYCAGCGTRIEKKLRGTKGVISAEVNYARGVAKLVFDAAVCPLDAITREIESLGYQAREQEQAGKSPAREQAVGARRAIGILIIITAVFVIFQKLGLTSIGGGFPLVTQGMSYGMVFLIGLLTSVHCVAMCGGINISQCIPAAAPVPPEQLSSATRRGGKAVPESAASLSASLSNAPIAPSVSKTASAAPAPSAKRARRAALLPSLRYNLGRIISYTGIGAAVGAVGSVITFTGGFKGIVQIIAGIFMIFMGLSMFGVLPGLAKLRIHLPRSAEKKIESGAERSGSPFIVGLLNGLMPCGPLQAMQLFALSSGGAAQGAIAMLLFSLGTSPLMFALGTLSSALSHRFTKRVMTIGAALVVFLGLFMASNGMSLSGVLLFAPFYPGGSASIETAAGTNNVDANNNAAQGGSSQNNSSSNNGDTQGGDPPNGGATQGSGADTGSGNNAPQNNNANNAQPPAADSSNNAETQGTGATQGGGTTTDSNSADTDAVQIIKSELSPGSYPHITVKAGTPVRWIITAPPGSLNGCNYAINIPKLGIDYTFEEGENIIEFTVDAPGEIPYSCWMGMIRSSITAEP